MLDITGGPFLATMHCHVCVFHKQNFFAPVCRHVSVYCCQLQRLSLWWLEFVGIGTCGVSANMGVSVVGIFYCHFLLQICVDYATFNRV